MKACKKCDMSKRTPRSQGKPWCMFIEDYTDYDDKKTNCKYIKEANSKKKSKVSAKEEVPEEVKEDG